MQQSSSVSVLIKAPVCSNHPHTYHDEGWWEKAPLVVVSWSEYREANTDDAIHVYLISAKGCVSGTLHKNVILLWDFVF
jgi:hypothetical protein